MKTEILPILTKLAAWKYAFQTPITCDVYFVNTKQFTNIKWGTLNPIMMRDPDFGAIRVRGYGAFSFRVDDAAVFLKELFGTAKSVLNSSTCSSRTCPFRRKSKRLSTNAPNSVFSAIRRTLC